MPREEGTSQGACPFIYKEKKGWGNEIGLYEYKDCKTVAKFATVQLEQDGRILESSI